MSLTVLLVTALTLGLVHTVIGPDHYLPFIMLGRAQGWSMRKALGWTLACGVGHVLSSVVLGSVGVGLGWAVAGMVELEGARGSLASWGLIAFGLVYFLWGLWRARRGGHSHLHAHSDGHVHVHAHQHAEAPVPLGHEAARHDHGGPQDRQRRTVWVLMIIFVLGPCEPLIPLLMVPAAEHSMWGVAAVAGVFGAVTVGTMLLLVGLGMAGLRALRWPALERYVHAVAGLTLLLSGLATQLGA